MCIPYRPVTVYDIRTLTSNEYITRTVRQLRNQFAEQRSECEEFMQIVHSRADKCASFLFECIALFILKYNHKLILTTM